ncbi:MAG TPA: hypothetical protein VK990_03560 [Acidimicrobiia bacterium]|nr:hypothetical protein [Acidimicrobiia bacterium]
MFSLKWRALRADGARVRAVIHGPTLWLSSALAVVAAVSAALTFFLPDVLTGPAVTTGNARGTALVMMVAGVPLLVLSMLKATRGSWRFHVVWLGILSYLTYNGFLLLFGTPLNSLFLLYVATFSLGLFSLGTLVHATEPHAVSDQLVDLPRRGLAIFVWTIVGLNALVWLRGIIPTIGAAEPTAVLDGLGLTTNPSWIQDLAFWLPMAAIAAAWLWLDKPWGYVLVGAWLVYGLIESVGVAVDQLFGYAADPTTEHATPAGAVIFGILALVSVVPMYLYFRRQRAQSHIVVEVEVRADG